MCFIRKYLKNGEKEGDLIMRYVVREKDEKKNKSKNKEGIFDFQAERKCKNKSKNKGGIFDYQKSIITGELLII